MQRCKYQYIDRIVLAAQLLGDMAEEVVFVGGAAAGLLVDDPAITDVRPTLDIDVVVEVATRGEYYAVAERLRVKGFEQSLDDEVICRWRNGTLLLDVMPTHPDILGFSNIWYSDSLRYARKWEIDGVSFLAITPPYFLGTKLEAFHGRGKRDFMTSHDMEDIIAVLDGNLRVVEEVAKASKGIRAYLASEVSALLADGDFRDALPGHLPGDVASQQRVPLIMERMRQIASNKQEPDGLRPWGG
jgi:predicted nucleotidyltransferase